MESLTTEARNTSLVGRHKKELPPTENDTVKNTMMRRDPSAEFRICPVCNQWALIWNSKTVKDEFYGMHPMGCFDTSAGQKIMYAIRKQRKEKFNQTLF